MKLLGLSAGNPNGSAEILLKEALRGAEGVGATVELVRLHDLRLSAGPDAASTPPRTDDAHPGAGSAASDDAQWFWDRLMQCDGLIVSTPIYARTVPGLLRLLGDKISGPQADVAFTSEILRMRASGQPLAVDFAVDERVLRPRVAGFIAVGGSLPPRWKSLALPLLHTLTASAQIAVVDQVEFAGAGSPASIVLDPAALARARSLGANVGSQLGRTDDEAEYRGEPGLCPLCHLSVIVVKAPGAKTDSCTDAGTGSDSGTDSGIGVECASCGAAGVLTVAAGVASFEFPPAGLLQSVLSRGEKLDHFHEVQQTAARHASLRASIDAVAAEYAAWDPSVRPAPEAVS